MPYVPVQRDEGRILYQSTMDRAKLLGDTLTGLGETLYKRDEENKAFRAKSSALKQLITTHKDQFGMDENALKQFLGGDPDKSEKENYLNLATFIEGKVMTANLAKSAEDVKNSAAQRTLYNSQAANQQALADETAAKNRIMTVAAKELEAINKAPVSADGINTQTDRTTFSAAPSGNASLGNISQFLTPTGTPQDPRANFDPRSNPIISSALTAQAGRDRVAVPASVAANYGVTGDTVATAPTGSAITSKLSESDLNRKVRIARLNDLSTTAKSKSDDDYRSDIIRNELRLETEKRKQESEQRQLTREQALKEQKDFNYSQKDIVFGERRVASVKESGTGGYYVLNVEPAQMTAIEKQAMEAKTKEEGEIISRIGKVIETDRASAGVDRTMAPAVNGLINLLNQDKIDGDSLIGLKTSIRNFGKSLGITVNENKLSDAQTATSYFGQLVLPLFNSTKGAISDRETNLFMTWSPQLGLNKKANLQLLSVIQKRMELNRKFEKLGNNVDSGKMLVKDYVTEKQKLIDEYDASLPTVEEFLDKSGAPSQIISKTISDPIVPGRVIKQAVDSGLKTGTSAALDMFNFLMPNQETEAPSKPVSTSARAPAPDGLEAFMPPQAAQSMSRLAAVNRAGAFSPAERLMDPEALQAGRQRFDTEISSPSEQFTLPQIKLSPEAKDLARKLREQYDESSAVLEKRAVSPRLTAAEDDGKAGSLKKKKTITLDEEGIKAILSNPRILVESFGDVMGDPYKRAMRNEATDAAFKRNALLREYERQFGVRTPARRGK
jgi:hypothetical protein